MRRVTRWTLIGVPLALMLLLVVLDLTGSHVDARYGLRLRGRLVDAATNTPLAGACVISFRATESATDEQAVERAALDSDVYAGLKRWIDEAREEGDDQAPRPCGFAPRDSAGETDGKGRFALDVGVRWSYSETVLGFPLFSRTPWARSGVRALRVEVAGRPTVILPVEGGTWTEGDLEPPEGFWSVWDLGEVRVTFPE